MKIQVVILVLIQVILVKSAAILDNRVEEDADEKKCPAWDKWETSKCLWPSQQFSSLPKACTSLPNIPDIPNVLKQFAESKQQEIYAFVQNLFTLRGAKSACGSCSRKIKCRQRKGGEWKRGCRFMQARMVDEECEGNQACVIKPILGACPPPIPMPHPPRRHQEMVGDPYLDIEAGKNTTQGPPLWHCARNKDGSKCLCCCGWFFPDSKSGKCVSIRKNDTEDQTWASFDDHSWNWNGLMDLDLQSPLSLDGAIIDDGLMEQIEAPPMENSLDSDGQEGQGQAELVDQMAAPEAMVVPQISEQTARQLVAPVTETVVQKKLAHEANEI